MLIINIGQLATPQGKPGSKFKVLYDAYVKIVGDTIAEIGMTGKLKGEGEDEVLDAKRGVVIPGLVDPHTHAVFAGTREEEFLRRCRGEKYGKGILTTVAQVRAASENELYENSKRYLKNMLQAGTTTVEIKSGYGLNLKEEMKILHVIRKLSQDLPLDLVPTFLGAHAPPPEVSKEDYIAEIISHMIPKVKREGLAEFCDVFCEEGFFTLEESREILTAAKGAGLKLKIHADELSPGGGAELAAELGATSADHLLMISKSGIKKLKRAGVIPVLLPGTAFTLRKEYPPAREMIKEGLAIALGTDFNPGTCLINSMFFMISLAVMRLSLTAEEALAAATLNAAAALKRDDSIGSIEVGKKGDILVLELENYKQIPYFIGHNFIKYVIKNGKVVHQDFGLCKAELRP
jgi:imidazolonepropionase